MHYCKILLYIIILTFDLCCYRTAGAHVTTTFTSSNNLGLVITGLTEADVGTYTCTATYSNSEYLVRSVIVDSFCKSSKLIDRVLFCFGITTYYKLLLYIIFLSKFFKTISRGLMLPLNNIRSPEQVIKCAVRSRLIPHHW